MRLLVTGATGFVGSILVPRLIERYGPESVAAYALPGDRLPASWGHAGIRVFRGDITALDRLLKAVEGRSHVIHLAGFISYWRPDFNRLMRVNFRGTKAVVNACLQAGVKRLVHISSVGAIGFKKRGEPIDESTAFNWPPIFHYMTSKYLAQLIVEQAVRAQRLNAVIFNLASVMGPGDFNPETPHNQLYSRVYRGRMVGSFNGGLGVVDVRDVAALIIKGLDRGKAGQKHLLVGANLRYPDVLRLIGKYARRRVYPFPVPGSLLTSAGLSLEMISLLTRKRPLLTYAYGRLSGWTTFYSNGKSRRDFSHEYIPVEETIRDACRYFETTFMAS
ncbi:MAG: NAD-dependent epimerase/dehydratase family protein [Candidatus Aminicenantes bacterium]|nr:NAD-dependent epimerase/dehydratase family protein [Candidatus Aminicenantes bacterium]